MCVIGGAYGWFGRGVRESGAGGMAGHSQMRTPFFGWRVWTGCRWEGGNSDAESVMPLFSHRRILETFFTPCTPLAQVQRCSMSEIATEPQNHTASNHARYLFTVANAREMQARAVAARKLRKELANNPPATRTPVAPAKPVLSHPERRLARVRKQLDLLDNHMSELLKTKTPDFQAVERAARAVAALSELEQKLDGRPNPGSRRPREERRPARPVMPDPE